MSAQHLAAAASSRVLIVGSGLTGALTAYHVRKALRDRARIDVADMARGAGGRASTTRYEGGGGSTRANTGAQYMSVCSREARDLLEAVCASNGTTTCALDRVEAPAPRTTHFRLAENDAYTHYLPRDGTNSVVKQFLYAGAPDSVSFGARLQRVAADAEGRLRPVFDRGSGGDASYDAVVLAMPPKDILKFFDRAGPDDDRQSQAALHRRTNRGARTTTLPSGCGPVTLPGDVVGALRSASYVGRYSLALWFGDGEAAFVEALVDAWRPGASDDVLDAVVGQPGNVVVAQTTVAFWRRVSGDGPGGRKRGRGGRGARGGGGRDEAKASILAALGRVAGASVPRARHAKLLNWRTSQADVAAAEPVVTHAGLVFTGDWTSESSFEGCNRAAVAAAAAVERALAART